MLACFLCSHVILLGDLNYRISLPEETTRLLVQKRDWDSLLQNDQVRVYTICIYVYKYVKRNVSNTLF